ncbi:MAG: tetratricopeptide repeat protein [Planctomycetes bacterium]|nr:tetratricopeptide repeat protein [Planctomycetota bacterium]
MRHRWHSHAAVARTCAPWLLLAAAGCTMPPAGSDASSVPRTYREAELALAREDYAGAARGLRTFLSENPGHPLAMQARYSLGTLLLRERRHLEARDEFGRVAKGAKDRTLVEKARLRIAETHLAQENPKEAEPILKALAASAGPEVRPDALYELGRCLQRQGRADEATAPFETLRRTYPQHPRAADADARMLRGSDFTVQAGAFRDRRNAEALARALRAKGFPAESRQETRRGMSLWIVRSGHFQTREEALAARDRVRRALPKDAAKAEVDP